VTAVCLIPRLGALASGGWTCTPEFPPDLDSVPMMRRHRYGAADLHWCTRASPHKHLESSTQAIGFAATPARFLLGRALALLSKAPAHPGRYRVACPALMQRPKPAVACQRAHCGQGQGALTRAGLRPSLTSIARAGLPVGRSGRRNDRCSIKLRNIVAAGGQAGVAKLGSNRLPVFNTPKQRTRSLRMAATTICFGFSRPKLFRRTARAATIGLKRIAASAGM